MIPFFRCCLAVILCWMCVCPTLAQKKEGLQFFTGVHSTEFVVSYPIMVNDSTEIELDINDDPGLHFGGLYHRSVGRKLHIYTLISGYFIYGLTNITIYRTLGSVKAPDSQSPGLSILTLDNMNGLRYDLNHYFSVSAGMGLKFKITTDKQSYNSLHADYQEIANSFQNVFTKTNLQFGVGATWQIKRMNLTLRYQRSIVNDAKEITYRNNHFQVPGRLYIISLDVGYNIAW